jgi:hypothetical protein
MQGIIIYVYMIKCKYHNPSPEIYFKIPMAYVLWLLSVGRDFSESGGTIFMDPSLVGLSH